MARKKNTDTAEDGGAVTEHPPEATSVSSDGPPVSDTNGNAAQTPHGNGTAEKRPPVMSFKCFSDGSTQIQVAIWSREVQTQTGSFTQFSCTVGRSWRDQQGNWHDSSKDDAGNTRMISFRNHDIPVLCYLLDKAYGWILSQRVQAPF